MRTSTGLSEVDLGSLGVRASARGMEEALVRALETVSPGYSLLWKKEVMRRAWEMKSTSELQIRRRRRNWEKGMLFLVDRG